VKNGIEYTKTSACFEADVFGFRVRGIIRQLLLVVLGGCTLLISDSLYRSA
jgi:hypothetical protein